MTSAMAEERVLEGLRKAQGKVLWTLPKVPGFTRTVVAAQDWTLRDVWGYGFQGAPQAQEFPRSVALVLGQNATIPTPTKTTT